MNRPTAIRFWPRFTTNFILVLIVTLGQGEPLVHERVVWTADMPLTMGQLQGRRDTFWDTAPMYDGRREIWDALKAAVDAAEKEDYDLAQAILSGANITLPTGVCNGLLCEDGGDYLSTLDMALNY